MPTLKTRNCQNCKKEFTIFEEDQAFYEKIQVPAPTFCPECRMRRRQAFRNERALYKRECGLCKKSIVTGYPPEMPFPVYCNDCWYSDKWGGEDYAMDYDPNKSFWLQFKELKNKVPRLALNASLNQNCDFANYTWECKNVYLSTSTLHSENIFYSASIDRSENCIDCLEIGDSQFCYENFGGENNYGSTFLSRSHGCTDSHYLFDCRNCTNCFMSSNLRNKEFVFENQQLTKEEYEKKISEKDLGNFESREKLQKQFQELQKNALHKFANIVKSEDVTGERIIASKNVKDSFDIRDSENLRYCVRVLGTKDAMDANNCGPTGELLYETIDCTLDDGRYKFCTDSWENNIDLEYADLCMNAPYVFGCVGMKKKSYCILNKQYTKEEYEKLLPKIKEHMTRDPYVDKKGRTYSYGEFFPVEFSPYAHNTTLAQEYFPLTKEETIAQGYTWRDAEEKTYKITKKASELPLEIKDVPDTIIQEVISCAHEANCNDQCTNAFRILKTDLEFYKKLNVPLPRLCPNCRHANRLKQKNPLKLWGRSCDCNGHASKNGNRKNDTAHFHGTSACPNTFQTSYAPERPETIYCEQCYQAEIAQLEADNQVCYAVSHQGSAQEKRACCFFFAKKIDAVFLAKKKGCAETSSHWSERSVVVARMHGVHEVAGSIPAAPTKMMKSSNLASPTKVSHRVAVDNNGFFVYNLCAKIKTTKK